MTRLLHLAIIMLLGILCMIGIFSCRHEKSAGNSVPEKASAAFKYLQQDSSQGIVFHAVCFGDGVAVSGLQGEVFWVKEGEVFTVNDVARQLAPNLHDLPVEIDRPALLKALSDEQSR